MMVRHSSASGSVIGRQLANLKADVDGRGTSTGPLLAVLLPQDVRLEEDQFDVQICAEAELRFHGSPRRLYLLSKPHMQTQTQDDDLPESLSIALQIEDLWHRLQVQLHEHRAMSGPFMWLLHNSDLSAEITRLEAIGGLKNGRCSLRTVLSCLRIWRPTTDGNSFIQRLSETYGRDTSYSFAWANFYIARLWVLAGFVLLAVLTIGAEPGKDRASRISWESFKVVLVLWGFWVAAGTYHKKEIVGEPRARTASQLKLSSRSATQQIRCHSHEIRSKVIVWNQIKIFFCAIPVMIVVTSLTVLILLSIVQLNLWLTYAWGDCVKLGCFDPEEKHGFLGWLAEVGADVLLALVFEGLLAIAKVVGEWVATLHNYEWQRDHDVCSLRYAAALEGIGKVGTYVIIALVFVPQWTPHEAHAGVNCSDLASVQIVGEASISCLRRRLPSHLREFVLVRMMNGPFVVAPFVSILIKVVIPWVVERLDLLARTCVCYLQSCDVAGDTLARLLGLIFSYDGDMVGCLKFLTRGWPFTNVVILANSGSEESVALDLDLQQDLETFVDSALSQASRKPFEPLDEVLELKLSFLWVVFFAPLKPIGVLPTLGARFLEVHTDLAKLLYVRRRPCPNGDSVLHRTQRIFIRRVAVFALLWSLLLSLVVFNRDIWKWVS